MRAISGFNRTGSGKRSFDKNYFIASEGTTEYLYFTGVKRNRDAIGINGDIDIQCISRYDQNVGESNPLSIIVSVNQYIDLIKNGNFSVELFVGRMMQDLWAEYCKDKSHECYKMIYRLQKSIISKIKTMDSISDGTVILKGCYDDAAEECRKIANESGYSEYVHQMKTPSVKQLETYNPDLDKVCLVVDRDKESFSERQIEFVKEKCGKKVDLYMSNPAFEFWLALHYDESLELTENDIKELLENAKVDGIAKSERVIIDITKKYNWVYNKTMFDFEKNFMKRIDNAIENSQSFETDLDGLTDSVGTNVGSLMKDMKLKD